MLPSLAFYSRYDFFSRLLATRDAEDTVEIELPGKKYDDMVEFLCCIYPDLLSPVTGTGVIKCLIVYSAPSCASQPISLHRNLNFWPTLSHILLIFVISIK